MAEVKLIEEKFTVLVPNIFMSVQEVSVNRPGTSEHFIVLGHLQALFWLKKCILLSLVINTMCSDDAL